jgi:hypothetical protein
MASTKLPPGTSAYVARFVGIYLGIELVPFIAVHFVYHKPVAVLVVPFLLFGLPAWLMIAISGIWLLDARGASPRLLGLCWFWMMMAFISAAMIGMGLGGIATHSMSRSDVVGVFILMLTSNAPVMFFWGYLKIMTATIARRAAKNETMQGADSPCGRIC